MATTEKTTEKKAPKMVRITLPKTKYEKDDYWLAINGRYWQIQRGVPVEVPEYVAEAIQRHQENALKSMEYIDANLKNDEEK
jgi:hypothetical protein